MSLTGKQQAFVLAYIGPANANATEAARRAGYSEKTAAIQGHENLRKPNISAAIKEELERRAMPAEEVLSRLTDQARAGYAEHIGTDGCVDLDALKQAGLMHLVKKISQGRYGLTIEFHDPQAALQLLGKHHGLFTEKHEVTVHDDGTAEALDRKLDSLAARFAAAGVPGDPDPAGEGSPLPSVELLGPG